MNSLANWFSQYMPTEYALILTFLCLGVVAVFFMRMCMTFLSGVKKPTLVYPETFIAEREVNGQKEYAFGIRRKFLWWNNLTTDKIIQWKSERGYEYIPDLTDDFSCAGQMYFDSPKPVMEAIDNLRKDVGDEYQRKLKQYKRSQASNWTFKKYP